MARANLQTAFLTSSSRGFDYFPIWEHGTTRTEPTGKAGGHRIDAGPTTGRTACRPAASS